MIIAMSELVIIATVLGTILTALCGYMAVQQTRGIKCLKEISKDMKVHMHQLHEEHKELGEKLGEKIDSAMEKLGEKIDSAAEKILTAITSSK
ncbi:MAG: hypothetical protein QMD21_06690 [Candidatus Thermoplasmatota archaeon]|nr:hypothetical protein [Candidatus Thermoplasmatota archaeon]MDI6856447.1 hypothetical protein [Candidatus Thermoplasmatota archaeon]